MCLEQAHLRETTAPSPPAGDVALAANQLTKLQNEIASLKEALTSASQTPSADTATKSSEMSQRLTQMADRHGLSYDQSLDRAVATQFYLDQKEQEGWAIMLKRGRELRQVVLSASSLPSVASSREGRRI